MVDTIKKEKLEFGFNPYKSDNPAIRAVFQDQLAQIIWCAVKRNHIVDQHFNENCLKLAEVIRKEGINNMTGKRLNDLMKYKYRMLGSEEEDVGDKILPYIKGNVLFEYVYI